MLLDTPLLRAVPLPGSAFLEWKAVANAATYTIQLSYVNPGGYGREDTLPPIIVTPEPGQSIIRYTVSPLPNNTQFYVSLTARPASSYGPYDPSEPVTVEITTGLSLTTGNLLVTSFDSSALMTWASVTNATSYSISENGTLIATVPASGTQLTYWYEVPLPGGAPRVITVTANGTGFSSTMFMQEKLVTASGVSRYTLYTLPSQRLESDVTVSSTFVDSVSSAVITHDQNTIQYSLSKYNPTNYAFETVGLTPDRNSVYVLYKTLDKGTRYELTARFANRAPVVCRFTTALNSIYPTPGTISNVYAADYITDTSVDISFFIDEKFIENREASTNDQFRFWQANIKWYQTNSTTFAGQNTIYVRAASGNLNEVVNIAAGVIPIGTYDFTITLITPDGASSDESIRYTSYIGPVITDIRFREPNILETVGWTDVEWSYSTNGGVGEYTQIDNYQDLFSMPGSNIIARATPRGYTTGSATYVVKATTAAVSQYYTYMSINQRPAYAAAYVASISPSQITDASTIDSNVLDIMTPEQLSQINPTVFAEISIDAIADMNPIKAAELVTDAPTTLENMTMSQMSVFAAILPPNSTGAIAATVAEATTTILNKPGSVTSDENILAKNVAQFMADIFASTNTPPVPITYIVEPALIQGTDSFSSSVPIQVDLYATPRNPTETIIVPLTGRPVYINSQPGAGSITFQRAGSSREVTETERGGINVDGLPIVGPRQFVSFSDQVLSFMQTRSIFAVLVNAPTVDFVSSSGGAVTVRVTLNQTGSMVGGLLRYTSSNGVTTDIGITSDDPIVVTIPAGTKMPISFSIIGLVGGPSSPITLFNYTATDNCCAAPHKYMDYETYMRLLQKRIRYQRR